jgi:transcriptional regulator with XRE-family HTH domain
MRYKVLSGEEIRQIRECELHMPQEALANMTDTTRRTISKYEAGTTTPKGWFLKRFAEIRRDYAAKPVLIQLKQFTQHYRKRWELIWARGQRTQREIAKLLGVDFSTISKWETGRLTPSICWIRKLAELYRVTKEILFPDVFGQKETTFAEAA